MSPQQADRRVHPRALLATNVEVETEGRSFLAVVGDVSAGGMLIHTANPAAAGSTVELSFSLPDRAAPIRTRAVVRHVGKGSSMGVQFTGLTADERAAILAFVLHSSKRQTPE